MSAAEWTYERRVGGTERNKNQRSDTQNGEQSQPVGNLRDWQGDFLPLFAVSVEAEWHSFFLIFRLNALLHLPS